LKALTFISEHEGHMRHRAYKPNSVRCRHRDGHSSRPVITDKLKRPTRKFGAPSRHAPGYCYPEFLPYLVLLRVGFAMPRALLPGRCALTAPFHPYRTSRTSQASRACACFAFASGSKRIGLRRSLICGGIFSVALSVKWAWTHLPGRYPAHRSMEFGLSSLLAVQPGKTGVHNQDSDHPAQHPPPYYRMDLGARRLAAS